MNPWALCGTRSKGCWTASNGAFGHKCSVAVGGRIQLDARARRRGVLGRQALEGLSVSTDGDGGTGEWTMTATEFRARCYGLMDEVAETGREIVITKRGKPVARLVPIRPSLGA